MKKLFFVINSLESGGAERVLSILANELSKLRYNITIISKVRKQPFYKLSENVKVIYPPHEVNYNNRLSTFWGRLNVMIFIYKKFKRDQPDIVIPFCTSTNGSVILFARMLSIKVIASEHTNFRVDFNNVSTWLIRRWVYKLADKVTILTKADLNLFYEKHLDNVVLMPNPLALDPIMDNANNKREKYILAVGSVSRWYIKGFDNLMDIFLDFSKINTDWKLKIAGGGDGAYLQKKIKELKLNGKVDILGEVSDIKSLMLQSSIFALTSRWEGLPMVLIEAMSQGMPCIAYDCFTGPGEIITNNIDGILVENQNKAHFCELLSLLAHDEETRVSIGSNAIETSRNYLPVKIASLWDKLITETIK